MNQTKIEWTDVTWNVVTGCSKVSAGCANCYAERMAKRLAGRCGYPKENPFAVTFHPDRLEMPMRLKKPSRIFVNSMGDLFHPEVKGEWLSQVFSAMANAHWIKGHTFSVLTKRPERMKSVIEEIGENLAEQRKGVKNPDGSTTHKVTFTFPLKGVELGVSVEDQKTADERIPILLKTPAAMRFVSYEPALGPVDFTSNTGGTRWIGGQRGCAGTIPVGNDKGRFEYRHFHDDLCEPSLDWVIMGGETGPKARPMNPEWARKVRDDCAAAGVPFFFKGSGGRTKKEKTILLDGVKHHEFPKEGR